MPWQMPAHQHAALSVMTVVARRIAGNVRSGERSKVRSFLACVDREPFLRFLRFLRSVSFQKLLLRRSTGLPGELRTLLAPHTESADVALLIQFLTYFGVLIAIARLTTR